LQVLIAEVNIKISGREIQTCLQERLDVNSSISSDQQRAMTNGMDPDKYSILSDDTHREQRKMTHLLHRHISVQKSHIYGREHCETQKILAKHLDDSENFPWQNESIHYLKTVLWISRYSLALRIARVTKLPWKTISCPLLAELIQSAIDWSRITIPRT